MWINVFDDEGNVVNDRARREVILLAEESRRLKAFLNEVESVMGVESHGVEDFGSVVDRLKRLRADCPDRASEAKRYLNRAAAIDADLYRHEKYIEKSALPIDIDVCLA